MNYVHQLVITYNYYTVCKNYKLQCNPDNRNQWILGLESRGSNLLRVKNCRQYILVYRHDRSSMCTEISNLDLPLSKLLTSGLHCNKKNS